MIVGNGDIATALVDRKGILFFASGVSNSMCDDLAQFQREFDLIKHYKDTKKCFVYFSTISIYDKHNKYTVHKTFMEDVVRSFFKNYCIIRIGNIDWGKNPNTFLNFIRNKIDKGETFEIRDEYKYMISRDQLTMITNSIPLFGQREICVFGYKAKVKNLIPV